MRNFRITFLVLILSAASYHIAQAKAPLKNVLLLNSYHKGFLWTDEITRGVQRILNTDDIELHIEYMDTKRQFGPAYQELLTRILNLKYNRHRYDAVIVSDDNAFNFAARYRQEIFGETPIIFCGVNYVSRQRLEGMPNVTGVSEEVDINASIRLIQNIHPDCRKIVVVTDNTTTGKRIQEEVRRVRDDRGGLGPEIDLLYDASIEELSASLRKLDRGSIVLFTLFFRDRNDVFMEYDHGTRLVSESAGVPVYGVWDFNLGHGIVGGNLVTGIDQGIEAAKKTLAVLNGADPDDIPVQYDTPTQMRFDYRQLQRHHIPLSHIPETADIYYQPVSFYDQHKKLIWLTVCAFALLLTALLGVSYGLIRSRQAEREIMDFKKAMDSAADAIGMSTPDGRHYYQNHAFSEMFGDIGDDPPSTLYVDEHVGRAVFESIISGNEWIGEVYMYGKHKQVLDIFLRAYPVKREGKIVALVGVHTDITERKKSEAELQKMEKLKSIGILAGGIAHDFNNILTGLFGNISIARESLSSDHPAYRSIEEAEKSMSRATRLTKQLLTFAKGGQPVKEDANLTRFVKDVVCFDLSGSNVKPIFNIAENLWSAEVDTGQIQQVFSNLAINANQAMPDGGRLYIVMENANLSEGAIPNLKPGKYIRITMRDEGIGIERDHLARIFDPYFSTKPSGNGLGLTTVYSIIEKHGGHVNAVSEPGAGSTFTLYLPASEKTQPPASSTGGAAVPSTRRSARVLVMDDEKMIREVASDMLKKNGYEVETAPDGETALELYRQSMTADKPFDLVIMDLTVRGGMGGAEAVKRLLALDPDARAIVSSGYAGDPVLANHTAYGFKGIVSKPYTQSQLQEAINRVLGK